jgi:hypothetical protein
VKRRLFAPLVWVAKRGPCASAAPFRLTSSLYGMAPLGAAVTLLRRCLLRPCVTRQRARYPGWLPCSARHCARGEREVFSETGKVVPHIKHRQSVVRNANQEAYRQMNALDRAPTLITDRASMFGFFLLIFFLLIFF